MARRLARRAPAYSETVTLRDDKTGAHGSSVRQGFVVLDIPDAARSSLAGSSIVLLALQKDVSRLIALNGSWFFRLYIDCERYISSTARNSSLEG